MLKAWSAMSALLRARVRTQVATARPPRRRSESAPHPRLAEASLAPHPPSTPTGTPTGTRAVSQAQVGLLTDDRAAQQGRRPDESLKVACDPEPPSGMLWSAAGQRLAGR